MQLRQFRDAGIPWRRMESAHSRVCGQPPDKRMFPAAPANHKYSHVPGAYSLTSYSLESGESAGAPLPPAA